MYLVTKLYHPRIWCRYFYIVILLLCTELSFAKDLSFPIDTTQKTKSVASDSGGIGTVIVANHELLNLDSLNQKAQLALAKMDKQSIEDYIKALKGYSENKKKVFTAKTYYNLAVLFTKMKKYPLALKYFARSGAMESDSLVENKYKFDSSLSSLSVPQLISDSLVNSELFRVGNDTMNIVNFEKNAGRSHHRITYHQIMKSFRENRKEAKAYAVLLHIKQPSYGKRKQFLFLNNVGHMFVTLIQFVDDSVTVSKTFGFYPKKDNFLSATPLIPKTTGTFKDDQNHDWDETVGRFVTYKQFKSITRLVSQYSKEKYHLSTNNCTDFGLCIATIAGISIQDTKGSWPLGSGNDPGDAGQSILEGKVATFDGNNKDLFIVVNPDTSSKP